ncbi:MAG: histidinol dehydrogenase [Actinomycetota bacterium]
MLSVLDLRGVARVDPAVFPRAAVDLDAAQAGVREIVRAVAQRGDEALAEFTSRFDGVELDPKDLRVPSEQRAAAGAALGDDLKRAIELAAQRIRAYHTRQLPKDWMVVEQGSTMGEQVRAVSRAGLYAPGGRAAYPSSVLMNAIPAQVAGVESLALCSPCNAKGLVNPAILWTADLLGIEDVYRVGGAQAIAALAYGTRTISPVDVIAGPGNLYVAMAKREVSGRVRVDSFAGPSEVLILADSTAEPRFVAADLVAQAEHDPLAACLLVTFDPSCIEAVEAALSEEIAGARHAERARAALAGQGAAVLVRDLDQALEVIDAFAPEHLELMVPDPIGLAKRVRNAGAIFCGPYSPVAVGDYCAGSNHVLPTAGTARFSSGLSVHDFLKWTHVIAMDREALAGLAGTVSALANAEDLPAHARAVEVRFG